VVNRQRIDEIRTIGRATQGVRLMNLDKGDQVMDVARFVSEDEDDEVPEGGVEGEAPDEAVDEISGDAPGTDDAVDDGDGEADA